MDDQEKEPEKEEIKKKLPPITQSSDIVSPKPVFEPYTNCKVLIRVELSETKMICLHPDNHTYPLYTITLATTSLSYAMFQDVAKLNLTMEDFVI